ncbi:MAG: hypothetical protein KC484_02900 [Colwelliaceae bacterium]|nr:hypothetical protein [Colwelliaceae bacterium]
MAKIITSFVILLLSFNVFGKDTVKISTMDFIQIQQGYKAEALFFYKNNWKVFRKEAMENNYIDSFLFVETEATKDAPFHIVLITTYKDSYQFQEREKNFAKLMQTSNGPKLLNSVSPKVFRKKLFSKQKTNSFN